MNKSKTTEKLEKLILEKREEIRELKRQKRERDLQAKLEKKIALPSGRPKLKAELIEAAREMAKTKPISDVCLSLNVSRSTLYSYGISRRTINAEKSLETNCEAKTKGD